MIEHDYTRKHDLVYQEIMLVWKVLLTVCSKGSRWAFVLEVLLTACDSFHSQQKLLYGEVLHSWLEIPAKQNHEGVQEEFLLLTAKAISQRSSKSAMQTFFTPRNDNIDNL